MAMKLNRVACQFVDTADNRPIPLVIGTATDNTTVVSDNGGYISIPVNLPKGTAFYLQVQSPGYDIPPDGFGYRGIRLVVGSPIERIKVRRINIAQRSGRTTGIGKYIHAQTLGVIGQVTETPLTGMDSVQTAELQGTRFVFFGDTNWSGYPLGNFKTTTGIVKTQSKLPNCPYSIDYNTDIKGFPKSSILENGDESGVVWISGVIRVGDEIVGYANRRKSLQQQLAHGFVRWNPTKKLFSDFQPLPETSWKHLDGHPILYQDEGVDYVMFGHAIPNFRVKADVRAIRSGLTFETYSCLLPNGDVDYDEKRAPIWRWRSDGTPIDSEREASLIKRGTLAREQCKFLLTEHATKRMVIPHRGSVRWNAFIQRWVLVFTAINEPDSMLGELYIAAATTPTGPWTPCIRIATHPRYSFYNPVHHSWLDKQRGKVITIEGTYTMSFSGNSVPTPHYEYNQLTYQVDLSDVRLAILTSNIHK